MEHSKMQLGQPATSDFSPCTWEEVRMDQARRFASWTADEKLTWLTHLLELFPHVIAARKGVARHESAKSSM
jgi:hypothetical protein